MRKGDRSVTIIATGDILLHSEQSIKCECSTPGLTPLSGPYCMHQTLSWSSMCQDFCTLLVHQHQN